MTKKVFNLAGGKHSDAAYAALENRLFGSSKASVASFVVSAGSGMNADISAGDGLISIGAGSARRIQSTATESVAVAAASASFGRIDSVVAYIDNTVTPSTGVVDNTNDVLKFASVAGTAAATPSAPSGATIQAAIGSGNPYMILANILVPQNAVNLSGATFTNMAPVAIDKTGWINDTINAWLYASASTFTISGVDVTAQFPAGTKLRILQGTSVKYFVVKSSAFGANTTVTIDGGGTYTLANANIDKAEYSYASRPQGYPYTTISDPQEWMQELGRSELTSNGTSITVTFPAKRFLRIITNVNPASATSLVMTFNGDTANNYAYNRSNNGAADAATVSNGNILIGRGSTWTGKQITDMFIHNPSGMLKLYRSISVNEETAGAANAATGTDQRGKYQSNTQVTSVTITGSANALAAGSLVVVLGHD